MCIRDSFAVDEDLSELRGRIDANRQRLRYGLPLPIAVSYDEYGTDIVENQLLAGAASRLKGLPDLPSDLRRRIRRIGLSLDGVRPASRRDARTPVHFTRLNDHYRSPLALARVALEGTSFDLPAGLRAVTGFTVNMNVLFEKFLDVALSDVLQSHHGGRLRAHRSDHLDEGMLARIVPDLTWIV